MKYVSEQNGSLFFLTFLAGIEHKGGNSLFLFCYLLEIVADGHKYLSVSVVKQINFQIPIDTKY